MQLTSKNFTIDLRKLRLLRELDHRGTISATAAANHLTPSAVSQQIAGLSRELGVPLLERRGRGVILTGQARLLLSHADAVQQQLELARSALASWSEGTVGEVRIGSLATGIAALVAPAIARLRDERPDLVVTVSEYGGDEALELLGAGELDLIVASDFADAPTRNDARYHRIDLVTDVMDAVFPAGHPLADPNGVNLVDMAGEIWVGAQPGDACSHITAGVCSAAGFVPDTQHHCKEWDAVAALVAAGAGVALIPRLAYPLRQANVEICPVIGEPATRVLFALVGAGTQLDPGTAAVLETLQAIAAEGQDSAAL